MNEIKYCEECTHTHAGDFCKNALCKICGLGGDLTTMSCGEAQINIKQVEALLMAKLDYVNDGTQSSASKARDDDER